MWTCRTWVMVIDKDKKNRGQSTANAANNYRILLNMFSANKSYSMAQSPPPPAKSVMVYPDEPITAVTQPDGMLPLTACSAALPSASRTPRF